MSKFNRPTQTTQVYSPVQSESIASGLTYEGNPGFSRDAKSELFLLAVNNMVSEKTFYEDSKERDARYVNLIRQVATETEWLTGFFGWLRSDANMRSASLVGALEAVKARLDAGINGGNRKLVSSVLQRADEPGEALAYWFTTYGRKIPMPVKRGIADAANRMYNERNLIKYDTASHGFRFADVIELTHPEPIAPWQSHLFRHAIERRQGREFNASETLHMINRNRHLMSLNVDQRRSIVEGFDVVDILRDAGMTWENLAGWLQGPMDRIAWEAIIPSMGYMALLRNLRNFDEAEVSDEVAQQVANKLTDQVEVARSRQLPMRFLTAYRNAPSLRWSWPLEKAMNLSLFNIPVLSGRTLILVDTSSSMRDRFSARSELLRWDVAAMFGITMASACNSADLVSYSSAQRYTYDAKGSRTKRFDSIAGESILKSIERWDKTGYFLGGGTETELALREHYSGHNRVVIFTDEQAGHYSRDQVGSMLPASVPMYTFNLAGYRFGHAPSGSNNRHTFGGLTDQAFKIVPLLESDTNGKWPWEE